MTGNGYESLKSKPRDELRRFLERAKDELRARAPDDALLECGPAALQLLERRPTEAINLAHRQLHAWPFKDVPACWRRLYEEGSVWQAVLLLEAELDRERTGQQSNGTKKRKADEMASNSTSVNATEDASLDWLDEVVKCLDMAKILTDLPARQSIAMDIFQLLCMTFMQTKTSMRQPQKFPDLVDSLSSATINTTRAMDFLSFQKHLDTRATPLIIQDALHGWPAIVDPNRRWNNSDYLMECTLGGRRLVPVELGRAYTDDDWGQEIMTFGEYMQRYLLSENKVKGYLAQYDLLSQIPQLSEDTITPDFCYTSPPKAAVSGLKEQPQLDEPLRNAWLGPAGTISPLHTDPYHNILCQVVGSKYVRLYAPSETPKLYPRGVDEAGVSMENTSQVDISTLRAHAEQGGDNDADMLNRFPLVSSAEYIEGIVRPGECLYIPLGWWHYVESLSVSFSVSYWWN